MDKTEFHISETKKHRELVGEYIELIIDALERRADGHDLSKLDSPELEGFTEFTPKLRTLTYGSKEYKDCLAQMKPFLDHHYSSNRHHVEHHKDGIDGMNLVDIIEMFCDWLAAVKRHDDGDIKKSIKVNKDRYKYGDVMENILNNTVDYFKIK